MIVRVDDFEKKTMNSNDDFDVPARKHAELPAESTETPASEQVAGAPSDLPTDFKSCLAALKAAEKIHPANRPELLAKNRRIAELRRRLFEMQQVRMPAYSAKDLAQDRELHRGHLAKEKLKRLAAEHPDVAALLKR